MKKLLVPVFALVFSLASVLSASAQCGEPVSIVTAYYSYEAHTKFGFGLEGGIQGVDSRLGMYMGICYKQLSPNAPKKDSASVDYRASFYMKGTIRLTRADEGGSVYVVASPQLSLQSGFDMQSGLRFMYPLSGKKGIGLEPLYSINRKVVSLNFLLAF